MAKVGEFIFWGYEDNPVTFRVGYHNKLEQVVDTLTREEWVAQERYVRLGDLEERLDEQLKQGLMTPEARLNHLVQCEAEINSEAGILFNGDEPAEVWLARYALEN